MDTEQNKKFEVREYEILEGEHEDILKNFDTEQDTERTRTIVKEAGHKKKKSGADQYGWAFFLASMFIGLGITATTGHPLGLFLGMGLGFLFFVDPFYEKFMKIFDKL